MGLCCWSSAPRTSAPQLHLDEVYPLSSARADQGVQSFLCNVHENWIVRLLSVTACSLGVRGFSENGCRWNTKAPGLPHPNDDCGAQRPREGGGGTGDSLGCSYSP